MSMPKVCKGCKYENCHLDTLDISNCVGCSRIDNQGKHDNYKPIKK
jgi:hypothetical protein